MRQAVMIAPGQIEFRQIEAPQPGPGEVLLRTRRIGVCGSDIHVFHGLHPYTSYPVVQGHEVSGTVSALGSGVTGVEVGDTITFTPQVVCGECYSCRQGMYNRCETLKVMGFQTDGAAQDYFALPAWNVFKLPAAMPLDYAAMIEPVSVAVHAVGRSGGAEGQKVLVLGAGTIGNLVAQVAQASGAVSVMITDLSDYKLDKARECGIGCAINTAREDLGDALRATFGPDRADLIIECVGVQATAAQAIEQARKGSTLIIVGVFGKKPELDIGLVQDRELTVLGSAMYRKPDYERAIELVSGGKLCLDRLVTHRFDFEHYLEAYHAIEQSHGEYMKVMIDLD